jgi:hypothetical protein
MKGWRLSLVAQTATWLWSAEGLTGKKPAAAVPKFMAISFRLLCFVSSHNEKGAIGD